MGEKRRERGEGGREERDIIAMVSNLQVGDYLDESLPYREKNNTVMSRVRIQIKFTNLTFTLPKLIKLIQFNITKKLI